MPPDRDLPLGEPGGTQLGRIAVTRLVLTDFRNYSHLRMEPAPVPVVLTGANGAGKTNLLEAVSLLAPGRGMRGVPFEQAIRIGAAGWAIAATVAGPGSATEIGTGYTAGESGRVARIDREPARTLSALGELVRVLWLTPAMDGLFTGPAGDRRRFLDRLVLALDAAHGGRVADFERTMRQRNRLLEGPRPDARWLDGIEAQMAALAVAVASARVMAVERLSRMLDERAGGVFPTPALRLEGMVEALCAEGPAIDAEIAYGERLAARRGEDAAAGRTLDGPHRSDLTVSHAGRGLPASLASTGEQKGLLIALVLAHARLVRSSWGGVVPLLLLDEIAAHLDDLRRSALFSEILDLGAQAWMTGTDRALFTDILDDAQAFEVRAGMLAAG